MARGVRFLLDFSITCFWPQAEHVSLPGVLKALYPAQTGTTRFAQMAGRTGCVFYFVLVLVCTCFLP